MALQLPELCYVVSKKANLLNFFCPTEIGVLALAVNKENSDHLQSVQSLFLFCLLRILDDFRFWQANKYVSKEVILGNFVFKNLKNFPPSVEYFPFLIVTVLSALSLPPNVWRGVSIEILLTPCFYDAKDIHNSLIDFQLFFMTHKAVRWS